MLLANLLVELANLLPLLIIKNRHIDRTGNGRLSKFIGTAGINQQGAFSAQGQGLFKGYG